MRRRDFALRNSDEAGEPCLRRQQIVIPRVKTLNGELRAVFKHWYLDFPVEEGETWAA